MMALRACPEHSKVADILVYSLEVLQMPVRRSEEEPLQKLAAELRGALDVKARAASCSPSFLSGCAVSTGCG